MRAVVITGPGTLAPADVPEPAAGPDELLVEVSAAGVNRADLLQASGSYPPPAGAPDWPGLEVSGTVLAVGGAVAGWAPGDRVAALLPGGGYAERVAVHAGLALRVPDEGGGSVPDEAAAGGGAGLVGTLGLVGPLGLVGTLGLVEAAALPEALATVWSTLTAARLAAGETLLVRGGSGGIGTVAVQLAHAMGARVIATAGGPQRCERVRALGAEVVVDHRVPGLVDAVLAATGGAGVDVVLDVLGAGGLTDNLAVLADGGRLAVIGLQKGARGTLDLGLLLSRRATLLGTTLRSRPLPQKLAILSAVREHTWPMVADGRVRPVIHTRLPLAEAGEAHRLMAAGEVFGKVLLIP